MGSDKRREHIEKEQELATILITHQVPKGLQVGEVMSMGREAVHMRLVKEDI